VAIYKYKSFAEAERALWVFKPGNGYYQRLAGYFLLAEKLSPPPFPRGIHKYRSFESAQQQKMEWLLENAVKKKGK
jgi:hypothetical protein